MSWSKNPGWLALNSLYFPFAQIERRILVAVWHPGTSRAQFWIASICHKDMLTDRLFVSRHYLFGGASSFLRVKLQALRSRYCLLGQICEHHFSLGLNGGYCVRLFFIYGIFCNMHSLKIVAYHLFPSFSREIFSHVRCL